jgi:hypothetical protein
MIALRLQQSLNLYQGERKRAREEEEVQESTAGICSSTWIERWRSERTLVLTPAGSCDDWYVMMATLLDSPQHRSLAVSNDKWRDHSGAIINEGGQEKSDAVSHRVIVRWRRQHTVTFELDGSEDAENEAARKKGARGFTLNFPPPFVREFVSSPCPAHSPAGETARSDDQSPCTCTWHLPESGSASQSWLCIRGC